MKIFIILFSLMTISTLVGCSNNTQSSSSTTESNADDIFPVPGLGPQYRANVHMEGVDNPWPEIESVTVTLEDPVYLADITYRDNMEAVAGKTVNNIFEVFLANVDMTESDIHYIDVNIHTINLPVGMSANTTSNWHGGTPENRSKVVVSIKIGEDIPPGEYPIEFQIEIDGKDYGRIPCVITVLQP